MKTIKISILYLLVCFLSQAQDAKLQFIDSLAKRSKPHKLLFVSLERKDSMDLSTNTSLSLHHYFYLDTEQHQLRSVHVYETSKGYKTGKRFIYTFYKGELIKVRFVPSSNQCKRCRAEYFFSDGRLIDRKEINLASQNEGVYLQQANLFLSKMPVQLPLDHLGKNYKRNDKE